MFWHTVSIVNSKGSNAISIDPSSLFKTGYLNKITNLCCLYLLDPIHLKVNWQGALPKNTKCNKHKNHRNRVWLTDDLISVIYFIYYALTQRRGHLDLLLSVRLSVGASVRILFFLILWQMLKSWDIRVLRTRF